MAATYSQMKTSLDEISSKIVTARNSVVNARAAVASASSILSGMATAYGTIVTDINQAAASNPTDNLYAIVKAEKDKLVAEFQALQTYCDAVLSAIDGVE
jgi:hypothetical protein